MGNSPLVILQSNEVNIFFKEVFTMLILSNKVTHCSVSGSNILTLSIPLSLHKG